MNFTGATSNWPEPLSKEAFHGLAGDIVHTIEPHTESDPAALLVQLLVAFGNVIDRGLHWRVEAKRHGLNLFAVLVGDTSKSRKGSSWAHVRRLFAFDNIWDPHCIQTGLSSGEGLIYVVRDPQASSADDDSNDSGPLDTRLLVMESEFASPLRMIGRDGNTLSPVVRQAWDGDTLQVMTRNSPIIATMAHVSIIGHITRVELLRELTRIDAATGFGNRFLWACVCRSKELPEGGSLPEADFNLLSDLLKQTVDYARSLGDFELRRNEEARTIWHSNYHSLSEGKPGLFGGVTSRAEAQVMRLACTYALLDRSDKVRPQHLLAALAVWRYCEASARYIFGDALGDLMADDLLRILRKKLAGLTRTEISAAFGRNRSEAEISRALGVLEARGLAKAKTEQTGGRPLERWQATNQSDLLSLRSFNS